VFAASNRGDLVRLDAAKGKTLWHVDTKAALSGGVGIGENMVLVGTAKGWVLAYDLQGKPLWQSRVSSEVLSAPQAAGEFVVVRSGDSRIFGLDARDGARRWEYQTKLVVLNVANGGLVWETVVAAPKGDNELERITDIAGPPLVEAGRVCAATFQGRVACYETQKGEQLWARPASSVDSLGTDDLSVYLSEDTGSVLALDRNTGASVWKQDKLAYRNLSGPLATKDYVVVGDFEGQVHYLKFEDGSFAARVATDGGAIAAAPKAIDDKVLIQTRKGGIYAISVKK
jgi:outer membrane protein assembly factor BamB